MPCKGSDSLGLERATSSLVAPEGRLAGIGSGGVLWKKKVERDHNLEQCTAVAEAALVFAAIVQISHHHYK